MWNTRLDEQPNHRVEPLVAEAVGLYSFGSQIIFSFPSTTQVSGLILSPHITGGNAASSKEWDPPTREPAISRSVNSRMFEHGSNAILLVKPMLRVWRSAPVPAPQSRTVLLTDTDATTWPSGEKATALTQDVWPPSVCRSPSQSDVTP